MSRPTPLRALTGLRFFAALAVLLCHYSQMGLARVPDALITALDGGRPAVSLFFVLSGFVLTYNYDGGLRTGLALRDYYVARFARIYPVHLLGLGIGIVTATLAVALGRFEELLTWYSVHLDVSGTLLSSFFAQLGLLTAWLPFASLNQPWNGPAWSISCEAFFYLLLPFLLSRLTRASGKLLSSYVVLGLLVQGAFIIGVEIALPPSRSGFLISQFPLVHLYEFVVGICSAKWLVMGGERFKQSAAGLRWTLLAVVAGIVILSITQPVRPVYFLLSPLFAVLIVCVGLLGSRIMEHRLVVLLGESSFALYILHVPMGNLLRVFNAPESNGVTHVLGVILMSVLVFRYYEEPMRKALRSGGRQSSIRLSA